MDVQKVAVVVVAIVFALVVLWRVRPRLSSGRRRVDLKDAKQKISAAKDPTARALALCDAGDLCAAGGRTTGAVGYYLRAMRADRSSAALVERAATGLARRPHSLEALLWRKLGADPWSNETGDAARVALTKLVALYAGPMIRNRSRARALERALAVLGTPPTSS